MALMYGGMAGRMPQGAAPPMTDGPAPAPGGGLPLQGGPMRGGMGRVSPQEQRAGQMQAQIQQMQQKLQQLQSQYSMAAIQTNNPTQLMGMQSAIQQLQSQIQAAQQSAQREMAMEAMRMQNRAQMPGAGSMSVGGGGGAPNQGMIDQSQLISMLSGMFSPSGGSSPYGRY